MAKAGRLAKELMVQELTSTLSDRPNFFITSSQGLEASQSDEVRKQLRRLQATALTVKRRLGRRGLSAVQLASAAALLERSTTFVFPSDDVVPIAKIIVDFSKANDEKLVIRGGWVDGQLLDAVRVHALAQLPPKPQLVAQLIGALESPMSDLVYSIDGVLRELTRVLEEIGKQKEGGAQAS